MAEKHPNDPKDSRIVLEDRFIIERLDQVDFTFISHDLKLVGDGKPLSEESINRMAERYALWQSRLRDGNGADHLRKAESMVPLINPEAVEPPKLRVDAKVIYGKRPPRKAPARRQGPDINPLVRLSNWFPVPSTRKKLKKFITEQAVDIAGLTKKGQHQAAKWLFYWTYVLLFYYAFQDLILGIAKTVRGKSSA